jgi:hypothetical protein
MNEGGAGCVGIIIALVIIYYVVVYIVIPLITITALIAGGSVSAAASGHGMFIGGRSFILTFRQAIQEAKRHPKDNPVARFIINLYKDEPAFLLPIYDLVWYTMGYLSTNIWPEVHKSAIGWFDKAKDWWNYAGYKNWFYRIALWSAAVGAVIGGLVHYVATFALVSLSILLLVIVITIGIFLASLVMIFLEIANRIYGWYYQISYICPTCHQSMAIPVHICDKCSAEHKLLWPSAYGILSHKCSGTSSTPVCDKKLATFGEKRNKLPKRCPKCKTPVDGLGGTNIHFPIIGGRAVGKSFYITMAMIELIENYAGVNGISITFPDRDHDREYRDKVRMVKTGKLLKATTKDGDSATAFNLQIQKAKQKVPKLLYIYDGAGEYWAKQDESQKQYYFKYVRGVLFIIDPFSIDKVRTKYQSQLSSTPGIISPSKEDLDTVYASMQEAFETHLSIKISKGSLFHQPIAVVVTKCDAFDLEDVIGEKAASVYMKKHPEITSEREAISKLVHDFLDEYSGNFLRNLKNQFANIKYFSCSSVGPLNNNSSATRFESLRVLEPLLWLMEQNQVLSGTPPFISKILKRR